MAEADYTRVANEYGLGGEQDLVAGIGFGKYSARQTLNRLVPGSTAPGNEQDAAGLGAALKPGAPFFPTAASSERVGSDSPGIPAKSGTVFGQMSEDAKRIYFGKGSESLQVEGQNDLLIYRARCCNPIRGEQIVGYVTRGKGVAVHARTCSNVQNLLYESDRRIAVEWSPTPEDLAEQLRKSQTSSKAARFTTPQLTDPAAVPTGTAADLPRRRATDTETTPGTEGAAATGVPNADRQPLSPKSPANSSVEANSPSPVTNATLNRRATDKPAPQPSLDRVEARPRADALGLDAVKAETLQADALKPEARTGGLPPAALPGDTTIRPTRVPGLSEVRQAAAPTPKSTRFPVRLVITCDDRSGMLKQLTATIADDDTNIRSVDSKSNPDGITANVEFVIETLDLSHLTKLTANLRRLPGIREVHRVSKV